MRRSTADHASAQRGERCEEREELPLVSIVIPVFNGANYLADAIDSALAQTWPRVEVIVVNDGSTDDGATERVALRYGERVRLVRKTNGGVASAVNAGIRAMRGTYLSWLSHDDIYVEDKIERQVTALRALGQPAMAFGDFVTTDASGTVLERHEVGDGHDPARPLWALFDIRVNGCATLIHRACLDAVGEFDIGLPSTQDYDMWFRLASRFPLIHVPGVAVRQRLHPGQGSHSPRHLDECRMLWLSMLDRMDDDAMVQHGGSLSGFALRLSATTAVRQFPVLRHRVTGLLRRCIDGRELAVVALTDSLQRVTALAERLAQLGLRATPLLALACPDSLLRGGRLFFAENVCEVLMMEASVADPSLAALRRIVDDARSELVWFAADDWLDDAFPIAALDVFERDDAVAACLPSERPGRDRGVATPTPLAGAVIRRRLLARAFRESTGSWTSLVHALNRLGTFQVVPLMPATSMVPVTADDAPGRGDRASLADDASLAGGRRIALLALLSALRRPLLAGVAWRLLRLVGSGRAERLLTHGCGLGQWVDSQWYGAIYPEVLEAGVNPVFHYLMFGHREGRDPSPRFASERYRSQHPEVARSGINPLLHYLAWGGRSGYQAYPSPLGLAVPAAPDGRPTVLVVLDQMAPRPRDLERSLRNLKAAVGASVRLLFLHGRLDSRLMLGVDPLGLRGRPFHAVQELDSLSVAVRAHRVDVALVLRYSGYGGRLRTVLNALDVPFDCLAIDDDLAGHHLEDETATASVAGAATPLEADRAWLVANARFLLACDMELAWRMRTGGVARDCEVMPLPEPRDIRGFRPWLRRIQPSERLRVALFGDIDTGSGMELLVAVLDLCKARELPLCFRVFGRLARALPEASTALLQAVDLESGSAASDAVFVYDPHIAWLPSPHWLPGAHAVVDAEALGLPIAAIDSGACMRERLRGRTLSWLLSPDQSAEDWLAFFEAFRSGAPIPATCDNMRNVDEHVARRARSIAHHWLNPLTAVPVEPES